MGSLSTRKCAWSNPESTLEFPRATVDRDLGTFTTEQGTACTCSVSPFAAPATLLRTRG
jgi:hypothetical protein